VGSPEKAEQLMIALEPEAASIFCQEKNMSDFQSEFGCRSVGGILSHPNTHYMVVDLGGNYCRVPFILFYFIFKGDLAVIIVFIYT